ncbi:MAG: hypothetical protein ABI878_02840 [Acidobacteriota bacterium]
MKQASADAAVFGCLQATFENLLDSLSGQAYYRAVKRMINSSTDVEE